MNHDEDQFVLSGPIEKATGIWPLCIAGIVKDELEHYFWVTLPEHVCDQLADRAERAFAHDVRFQRKLKGPYGPDLLRSFMRHWLSSLLYKERRDLFKLLPDSFKMGHRLPHEPHPSAKANWQGQDLL